MTNKFLIGLSAFCLLAMSFISCKTNTDCVCPEYYHPVCSYDGITYANECMANCAGVDYYDGTCAIDGFGYIQFSGDSLCGYLISTLDQSFKPDTLSPEFEVNGKLVVIKYRMLNQYFSCENPYGYYQIIQVIDIK